jgi:hypothetical protein
MFGLFNKKNKRAKVLQPLLTEEEKQAISEYKQKIRTENKALFTECMNELINKRKEEFINKVPQPFTIGQSVTYDHYKIKDYISLGWHGTISSAAYTFKDVDAFKGTFTAPVFKIYADTSCLYDKIERLWLDYEMFHTIHRLDKATINTTISNHITRLSRDKDHMLIQWIVDFDWASLRLPHEGSEEGWLNLRWGGFIADCFLPTDSKAAQHQIKMWKKEQRYLKVKLEYERRKEEMKIEIKKLKHELHYEINQIKHI